MHQLSFDFSERAPQKNITPEPSGEKILPITQWVQDTVRDTVVPTPKKYNYSESMQIGKVHYELKVSSQVKEWTYEHDPKSWKIRSLVFLIKEWDTSYKFKIGIKNYTIRASHTDEGGIHGIEALDISYIQKIDTKNGWARYSGKGDMVIRNFNYFQRIFGPNNTHAQLMPIIHRIILDISTKEHHPE